MRSYCELLVKTCHRRGAHAMGGMAAFIPSRRDAEVNAIALEKVREDKEREAVAGLRRHLGRAPRPRARRARVRSTRARRRGRTRSTGSATTSRSIAARSPRRRARRPARSPRTGSAQQRLRRHPVPRRLAPGLGRRRDQQPDGGRRHRRDLPLADLAVAPPRPLHRRRRAARSPTRRSRKLGAGYDEARALFERIATEPDYVEFLTLPAYDRLVAAEPA